MSNSKLLNPSEWLKEKYPNGYYLTPNLERTMKAYTEYVRDFTIDFVAENAKTKVIGTTDIIWVVNKEHLLSLKDNETLKIR